MTLQCEAAEGSGCKLCRDTLTGLHMQWLWTCIAETNTPFLCLSAPNVQPESPRAAGEPTCPHGPEIPPTGYNAFSQLSHLVATWTQLLLPI